MHFGTGKSRDVLCRACQTAWLDALVKTSATRTTRVQGRRHSVDWCGHVHLTFSRNCSCIWCKSRAQRTKLVHASTTASSSSAMLEQVRRDAHDKRDTLVTTRSTRRTCLVVTWCNEWNFGLWVVCGKRFRLFPVFWCLEKSVKWQSSCDDAVDDVIVCSAIAEAFGVGHEEAWYWSAELRGR